MVQSTLSRRLLVATALLSTLLFVGCSKDKSTSPSGGGGGALELNSVNLSPGAMYAHTFATAGTFPYHCKIHSTMTASVIVSGGGPATASVTINDNVFSTNPVTVGPGGTVTWTNGGGNTHTVTSD